MSNYDGSIFIIWYLHKISTANVLFLIISKFLIIVFLIYNPGNIPLGRVVTKMYTFVYSSKLQFHDS